MLPKFPEFKKLELADKIEIEKITSMFAPYSDFNFVSLWSWDIFDEMRVSLLNDNLVVRFTDYLTDEPFYSFLGNNNSNETVKQLLALSLKEGIKLELRLVPEVSLTGLDPKKYSFVEDRGNFDYIYSSENLAAFLGSEHSNSRRLIKKFATTNGKIHHENLDLSLINTRMQILKLDNLWKANKELNFASDNEEKALMRLLNSADYLKLINVGIYIEDELVAFTLNEKLNNQYSMSFFAKFDIKYRGAYLYSMQVTSKKLLEHGIKFINCEQDLGLAGLRASKESLVPVFYLKKYTVVHKY